MLVTSPQKPIPEKPMTTPRKAANPKKETASSALHFAPEKAHPADPQFITVLPDGREITMDDAPGCREVALRIELLSRGLIRPGSDASAMLSASQEAA